MTVGDPRTSWYTYQGSINDVTLTVHPKGLYLEYGLYLNFSSSDSPLNRPRDTLEVVLNFDLPAQAIITDSWLWVGNDIVKAKILDKWTASSIYEGIVNRRKDPSILSKKTATQYELRVFPMAGNQTRKVKITYLMPISWKKNYVNSDIPNLIVNTSKIKPTNLVILSWENNIWQKPSIVNDDAIQFKPETNVNFGSYYKALIPSSKFSTNLKMGYSNIINNGSYFSKHQQGNEGIYQLAIFPAQFLDSTKMRKAAILVDFDVTNSTINTTTLLNSLKSVMLENLNEKDSFNLIFSNFSISRVGEKWISATKTNIENAINSSFQKLGSFSNLPTLLANGIDFVKKNGNNGKIIVLSNSDNYDEYQVADVIMKDLINLMNPKIQIHISDFQTTSFAGFYINNTYFYGNDYLYTNIS